MQSIFPGAFGCMFAMLGGLGAFVTGVILLVQVFITGEAMFKVQVDGRVLDERQPLGIEFVSIFLAMTLGFVGVGLSQNARAARPRMLWLAFTIANFLMIPAAIGALVIAVTLGDADWLIPIAWLIVMSTCLGLATKHPSYRHANVMQQLLADPDSSFKSR